MSPGRSGKKRTAGAPQQKMPAGDTGSLEEGRRVLRIEAEAVSGLIDRLDRRFAEAVDFLYQCKGKVIVSGMGKSGLIGQKLRRPWPARELLRFFCIRPKACTVTWEWSPDEMR